VTQNEILAEREKATGKKWEISELTKDAQAKEGGELLANRDFSGLWLLLKAHFVGEGYGSDFMKDAAFANEKVGLPKQGLAETLAALVAGKSV
jgi:hypothetical protein